MATKGRLEDRENLLIHIGMLVAPIRALLEESEPTRKIPFVRSQFLKDREAIRGAIEKYCTIDGLRFDAELDEILRTLKAFTNCLSEENIENRSHGQNLFVVLMESIVREIRAMPVEPISMILPGESPFQTYCQIRSVCSTALKRIELFDPYLGADIFHTYLRETRYNTFIRVVTSERIMLASDAKGQRRRDEIVAVSKLLAGERMIRYAFYVTGQQHDRHLRVDDDILHLGGSIKDAGRLAPYTISTLSPSQSNHAFLDQLMTGATEWFGPNVPKHREK